MSVVSILSDSRTGEAPFATRPEQSAWISEPLLFLLALAGLGTAGLEPAKNCTSTDSHQKKKTHRKITLNQVNSRRQTCEQFSPIRHLRAKVTKPNSHVPARHGAARARHAALPHTPRKRSPHRSVRLGRPRSRAPRAAARNKGLAHGKESPKREQVPHRP